MSHWTDNAWQSRPSHNILQSCWNERQFRYQIQVETKINFRKFTLLVRPDQCASFELLLSRTVLFESQVIDSSSCSLVGKVQQGKFCVWRWHLPNSRRSRNGYSDSALKISISFSLSHQTETSPKNIRMMCPLQNGCCFPPLIHRSNEPVNDTCPRPPAFVCITCTTSASSRVNLYDRGACRSINGLAGSRPVNYKKCTAQLLNHYWGEEKQRFVVRIVDLWFCVASLSNV